MHDIRQSRPVDTGLVDQIRLRATIASRDRQQNSELPRRQVGLADGEPEDVRRDAAYATRMRSIP